MPGQGQSRGSKCSSLLCLGSDTCSGAVVQGGACAVGHVNTPPAAVHRRASVAALQGFHWCVVKAAGKAVAAVAAAWQFIYRRSAPTCLPVWHGARAAPVTTATPAPPAAAWEQQQQPLGTCGCAWGVAPGVVGTPQRLRVLTSLRAAGAGAAWCPPAGCVQGAGLGAASLLRVVQAAQGGVCVFTALPCRLAGCLVTG